LLVAKHRQPNSLSMVRKRCRRWKVMKDGERRRRSGLERVRREGYEKEGDEEANRVRTGVDRLIS